MAIATKLAQVPPDSLPNRPAMPSGVKLLRYEPKKPPVAIDVCTIVTDVSKFIQRELRDLDPD